MKNQLIVTHQSPDFDAIAYLWLMKRYAPNFENTRIEFVSPQSDMPEADSIGDVGREYDPDRWRFDHHQILGDESTSTCAAKMLWEHLLSLDVDVAHLEPLVEEIYQGDIANTPQVGLHTALWGQLDRKNPVTGQRFSDREVIAIGFELLDNQAAWLAHKRDQEIELYKSVVWKSEDNSVWAIRGTDVSGTFAAYDAGAKIVVYEGEPIALDSGEDTYPVGVSRSPKESVPHLGNLVHKIFEGGIVHEELSDELWKWFRHEGGFFAGRGGAIAPDPEPLKVDLVEIAKLINEAWKRG